ncbi:MAG: endonuclease III [Lachnospiraceae bacterium]|nr:MAG: endonuclease III [Lachnospiraceae bacterium]
MNSNTKEILNRLDKTYGTELPLFLHSEEPWQLLFATILSAQCTDARVNEVTRSLYKKYPDLEAFANADIKELENDIKSTGFYHNKAKNIKASARRLLDVYGGEMPRDLDDLLTLPGVGRKTANLIRGHVFDDPAIVVDTHVGRISRRLGFTKEKDPKKVEFDLMKELPKDHWIIINTQLITLGRTICKSQSPKCSECFLYDLCPTHGSVK